MARLSLPKSSTRGKSMYGRRILRTSGSMTNSSRRFSLTYGTNQTCLGIVASFYFIPFKNRFISLLILSNGLIFYTPSIENQHPFQYFKSASKINLRFLKFHVIFNRIAFVKKLSSIALLELSHDRGVQYCRGSGAKGRLFAFDNEDNTAIIELPSKLKKIFPLFSVCAVGRLMGEENKFFYNTKSGY
jgi:ribosomal protein L2